MNDELGAMLLLKPEDLKLIADQAEAAYPGESCGLLLGFERADGDDVRRRPPDHALRLRADGEDLLAVLIDGDDRRFAALNCLDQNVLDSRSGL